MSDDLTTAEETWDDLYSSAMKAVADSMDFARDRAIVWAHDRIQSLEAPCKLVDTPPSEPGWYWMATDLDPAVVVHVRLIGKELCADKCPVSFYPKKHKWGSAPLPLPMESDDG